MRGERGQTAAELMGVLFLAAAIIATISSTGFAGSVEQKTKEAICKLADRDGCQKTFARDSHPNGRHGSPLARIASDGPSGPPLINGKLLAALPFPGSVTVSCTADRRDPGTCIPKGKSGVSVVASGELKIERTPTTLDANGCPWQNLSVAATLKLTGQGELKGEKAGGSFQLYLGRQGKYQVTVSPGEADAIANGRRKPPNAVDPQSLHVGEAVQLNEDYYNGQNLKANYKALQVEMGYDSGHRVSSGVKRVDGNTVRLYVGDEQFVREALKLGVKAGDFSIGLGNTKELSAGKLHSIDFDIAGNAGWNAYQQFLKTGKLPHSGTAGTFNATHASTIRYTDSTEIQAKLGGIQFGGQVNSSEGRTTSTRNPDGSLTTVGTARIGHTEIAITTTTDAHGNPVGQGTRSLLLDDVDSSLIDALYQKTGLKPPSDLGNRVRIDMSDNQLNQLRTLALQKIANKIALNGKKPSLADVQKSLQQHHGLEVDYNGVRYDFGGVEMILGAAKTPNDELIALYHGGISSAAVLQSLLDLPVGVSRNVPVSINQPHC